MNRIPNNSSLHYERNIFNFKNVYPIREDTSLLNPLVFYNTTTKEVTYNPSAPTSSSSFTTILTSNTTYTMPSSNTILIATASSNAITITLPTAVGISGVMYKIIRTDTTLANPIIITTTSSQTIGGSGTSRKMYTANEVWEFVSDGSNWIILNHISKTNYISAGSQTITSTSDPQPGVGTTSLNELKWKRDGKMIYILSSFVATSTPSPSGSGDYLFTVVPSGITIDTNLFPIYNTVEGQMDYQFLTATGLGHCSVSSSSFSGIGALGTYSSTQMRMFLHFVYNTATFGVIGSTFFAVTSGNSYTISCAIPITEFDA